MNSFGSIILAMLMGVTIAGCQKGGDPTIKVGLIAELTGQIPAVGASCKNAAELAVKEINNAGGIKLAGKAYKVDLCIEDSASKPDQAASAAQKLINQTDAVAIVGPNSSSNALPVSEIAEKSRIVMIAPWSTNPKTTLDARTGAPKQYVFRACFTDTFEGHVLGKFAAENLGIKKAAVFFDVASEVLKSQSELFKKSFEGHGGSIVAWETYTTGDKDFTAQLTKIKKSQPEIIFLPSYYTDVPLQVQQARRLGISVPFLGSDAWSTEELIKMAGSECEGFYFCNHYSSESSNPVTRKFVEAYKSEYKSTPDDIAALTYDAFGLLWQALQKTGSADRQRVRDTLSRITDYKGVTGDMRFQAGSGDPVKGAVIMQIRGGKFCWYADAKP
ncbi:MAG: ABC transporter substrate-binding protein [Pseudomonadota bacterium]